MQTAEEKIAQFLDAITGRIASKERAIELREEVLDHLECKIEFYTDCGHDYEMAVAKAVEEMGDCSQAAEQLGNIHSRLPHIDLKNSLTRIAIGILIQFFNFDIEPIKGIIIIIGIMLVFSGLLQLRNINSKINYAWKISIIQLCFQVLIYVISITPIFFFYESQNILIGFIAGLIQLVLLVFLGLGLAEVVNKASEGYTNREFTNLEQKLKNLGWLYFIMLLLAVWGSIDQGSGEILIFPFIFIIIVILSRILKVRRFLMMREFGKGVVELSGKNWICLICISAACLILPYMISFALHSLPISVWQQQVFDEEGQFDLAAEIIGLPEAERIAKIFSDTKNNAELFDYLPYEEIVRLEGLVEIYSLSQSVNVKDGILESYSLVCLKEDGTAEQIFYFLWAKAPSRGSRDTILLPRGQYYTSENKLNNRVYIYSENASGKLMYQKAANMRLSNNTYRVNNSQIIQEILSIDYNVAAKKEGQKIFVFSSLNDYTSANLYRYYDENYIYEEEILHQNGLDTAVVETTNNYYPGDNYNNMPDNFPGCLYISRDKLFPQSYSASMNVDEFTLIHNLEGFGYTQSYIRNVMEVLR